MGHSDDQAEKGKISFRFLFKIESKQLGLFTIKKCINNNAYVIDLSSNIYTSSTFNISNIYKCYPQDDGKMTLGITLETSDLRNGEVYDVNHHIF